MAILSFFMMGGDIGYGAGGTPEFEATLRDKNMIVTLKPVESSLADTSSMQGVISGTDVSAAPKPLLHVDVGLANLPLSLSRPRRHLTPSQRFPSDAYISMTPSSRKRSKAEAEITSPVSEANGASSPVEMSVSSTPKTPSAVFASPTTRASRGKSFASSPSSSPSSVPSTPAESRSRKVAKTPSSTRSSKKQPTTPKQSPRRRVSSAAVDSSFVLPFAMPMAFDDSAWRNKQEIYTPSWTAAAPTNMTENEGESDEEDLSDEAFFRRHYYMYKKEEQHILKLKEIQKRKQHMEIQAQYRHNRLSPDSMDVVESASPLNVPDSTPGPLVNILSRMLPAGCLSIIQGFVDVTAKRDGSSSDNPAVPSSSTIPLPIIKPDELAQTPVFNYMTDNSLKSTRRASSACVVAVTPQRTFQQPSYYIRYAVQQQPKRAARSAATPAPDANRKEKASKRSKLMDVEKPRKARKPRAPRKQKEEIKMPLRTITQDPSLFRVEVDASGTTNRIKFRLLRSPPTSTHPATPVLLSGPLSPVPSSPPSSPSIPIVSMQSAADTPMSCKSPATPPTEALPDAAPLTTNDVPFVCPFSQGCRCKYLHSHAVGPVALITLVPGTSL